MKLKRLCILFLSAVIAFGVAGCGKSLDEMNVIRIEMSEESEARINSLGKEMGAVYFEEEGFESVVRPSFGERDPDSGMPKDENEEDLVFTNKLDDELYGNNHVYTLTPENGYERIILYIHGGAYVLNISVNLAQTCDRLAGKLNAKVYIPLYTLSPQGTYKEGYELMNHVYEEILAEDKEVIFMGDSAGGGLALGFTEDLAENQKAMPSKMILFSPWVDVTMTNPDIADYADADLTLSSYGLIECGKMWAGDLNVNDRKISPLYYEHWDKLPPTMLFVGTAEIFYPDVTQAAKKMFESGSDVTLVIGNGLYHVFPVYPDVPESDESIRLISDFISR